MMETGQCVWEKSFLMKNFIKKAGVLFYQVFHQNPKLVCFYQFSRISFIYL